MEVLTTKLLGHHRTTGPQATSEHFEEEENGHKQRKGACWVLLALHYQYVGDFANTLQPEEPSPGTPLLKGIATLVITWVP